jgi:hypothetical protein
LLADKERRPSVCFSAAFLAFTVALVVVSAIVRRTTLACASMFSLED